MTDKKHSKSKKSPSTDENSGVNEPKALYETSPDVDKWNPNKPFHGTQEEWWDHFHEIEKGNFSPLDEHLQRMEQWLKEQNK